MISLNKFTRSLLLFSAIVLPIYLKSNLVYAKDFKIGSVKQQFSFGGMCVSLLPNTQKYMLVIPFPSSKSQPVIA
jgi:hypothetical protein